MNIFFDNVDFSSSSGPNSFGLKLASSLLKKGHFVSSENADAQISFIQINHSVAPCLLRLDGIYFNSEQDWTKLNDPIRRSYDQAAAVVVQSNFDKKLIFEYFDRRKNVFVLRNGTDLQEIELIPPATLGDRDRDAVWLCASSWRPHKRLSENIDYFLEAAPDDAILLVAGENADVFEHDRIMFLGNLSWQQLISAMKASSHFLHLAWLDHCPNVVVDARACGCHIVCSSSGGTEEIAGTNSTVIDEDTWDMSPVKLYQPPKLDFTATRPGLNYESIIDIDIVTDDYLTVISEMIEQ